MEAIEIKLTGQMDKYDVYYRVNVGQLGWLDWAKDGASAGTTGFDRSIEASQIVLVEKDGAAPGSTEKPFIAGTLSGIAVSTKPTQDYIVGDGLNLGNGVITATCDESDRLSGDVTGSTAVDIPLNANGVSVTGFEGTTPGTKTLTVEYGGKTTTYDVTVKKRTVSSIAIAAKPNKTTYAIGVSLDLFGGKIKLTYEGDERLSGDVSADDWLSGDVTDGERLSGDVTGDPTVIAMTDSGVSVAGFDSKSTGTKTLTVSYGGKTATFDVTVVTNIEKTAPAKPTDLTTTVGSDQVTLNWNAPTDNGGSEIDGYDIYRDGQKINTSTRISYTDTDLSAGRTYVYTVRAVNAKGVSSDSDPASAAIAKRTDNTLSIQCANVAYGETVVPVVETNSSQGDVSFEYSSDNGSTWSTTVPTAIGTYQIRARVQATDTYEAKFSESVTFSVGKNSPKIISAPVASDILEGKTLADSTLTGTADVPGVFSWTDSTIKPTTADSGQTVYSVTFTPTDITHYNTISTEVKLTVKSADVQIAVKQDSYIGN